MTHTSRSGAGIIVILGSLGAAALLAMAIVALFVLSLSARHDVMRIAAPDTPMLITPVPTVQHQLSLVPAAPPTPIPAAPVTRVVIQVPNSTDGVAASVQAAAPPQITGPLVDPALSLMTGPVSVPLEIRIPALKITAPVLGVGLTLAHAMASPMGILADDPTWQTVFWYRGGGIPGDMGTATLAGHYDDALGRPAVFAFLGDLQVGDLIVVHDQRSGLDVPFIVTETATYTNEEAAVPSVLARIFGVEAVSEPGAPTVSDQISHLTLITCAGGWVEGSFNRRLVVYAIRASYPAALGV